MKRIVIAILSMMALIAIACQSLSALARKKANEFSPEIARMLNSLPKDLKVPPVLPSTIHDPVLLEGWIHLYHHREPVQLADGSTVSGRDLAQFIIDQSIPVVWDTDQKCEIASCSLLYCEQDTCKYEDGLPGVDPIYISLDIQSMEEAKMNFLVGTLAHEIFHRTAPYGKVWPTLYEEFAAFYVGAQIGHAFRLDFVGYDGLNPAALRSWFKDNGLMKAYQHFSLYPQSMNSVETGSTQNDQCSPPGDFAYGTSQYNQVACKNR
jgi:hypothetical protein